MSMPEDDETRDPTSRSPEGYPGYGDDSGDSGKSEYGREPLPNRLDRSTLGGCLGIACIFALLVLLWFAIDLGQAPIWISAFAPTLAFALGAFGLILVARVPTGPAPRTRNPLRPLTREGAPPLVERPAHLANRLSLVGVLLLGAVILSGYALLIALPTPGYGLLYGPLITAAASLALTISGMAVGMRRLPAPAWTWERLPLNGPVARQGGLLVLLGGAPLAGSLLTAMLAGYRWAPLAFGLLLLIGVFALPFVRRRSSRHTPYLERTDSPFSAGTQHDTPDTRDGA